MKVLVTGGYGFIGSHLAERFYKEGHSVVILDNLSNGDKERVTFKHKSILADCSDEACDAYYKSHRFDMVIHCAAQTSVPVSIQSPTKDTESNVVGLVNMLELSRKYRVKKFVFFSSAAVYGEPTSLPIKETAPLNPSTPYGINKMLGETYCEKWNQLHGLDALVFRLSNVYGPHQELSNESGVISRFVTSSLSNEPITIYGDGEQTRDFIYVGDVVEAVYRSVISNLSGTYNISTNHQTSVRTVMEHLSAIQPFVSLNTAPAVKGDIRDSLLDNTKLKKEIDWAPKYSLKEGLDLTWHKEYESRSEEKKQSTKTSEVVAKIGKSNRFSMRLIENGVLFAIFLALAVLVPTNLVPVDMWLVYILFAGLLFGKYQAMIASVLAVSVIAFTQVQNGRGFTSLIADNSLLVTFSLYLIIGFVVGYIVDRRKIELAYAEEEKVIAEGKLDFMTGIYEDTREIKDELQTQILYAEDSIGKVYQAVKDLDYLEPEDVFSNAIDTLEKLLHHNRFAIYQVSQDGMYLRLMARSTSNVFTLPHNLQTVNTLFGKVIRDQTVTFNKDLQSDTPTFAAPIEVGGKVIGVVAAYDIPFERLSLYYKNTIEITLRLISSALIRAYQHIEEVQAERYVEDTHVLKPFYYEKIIGTKEKARQSHQLPYVRLELPDTVSTAQLKLIEPLLRSNDYLGQRDNGRYECLLSNTTVDQAEIVQKRLRHFNIDSSPVLVGG